MNRSTATGRSATGRTRHVAVIALVAAMVAGCAGDDTPSAAGPETAPDAADTAPSFDTASTAAPESSNTTTPPSSTTSTTTSASAAASTTTSTSPATTTATVAVPTLPGSLDLSQPIVGLGYSAGGRAMFAERFGTVGGRRVLIIGVIHGDEDDGLAIVEDLRSNPVPDGVELWLVDSMNPDGVAAQDRHNANDVDLNRNFPYRWGPIGVPGDGQYAGTGPASEPETQAMVNLITQLRPDIVIWYHQDLYVINPAQGREGRVRARYAELTDLPLGEITGGTYTGVAATWARQELAPADGVAFIVELGASLTPADAEMHAAAVRTIAVEG